MTRYRESHLMVLAPLLVGVACLCATRPRFLAAQAVTPPATELTGIVTDTAGHPIPLASLADDSGRVRAVANDSGRFRIQGLTGRIVLTVTRIGYHPLRLDTTVVADTTTLVTLRLVPLPVTLPAEEISGPSLPRNEALERLGFYQRMRDRRLGTLTATFITPEDLERREEGLISLALHGVPGIRLRPKNSDATQWMVEGRGGCEMGIWIDGHMVQKGQASDLPASITLHRPYFTGVAPRSVPPAASLPVAAPSPAPPPAPRRPVAGS